MSRLLMLLVAVDAISKLGALLLLPEDRLVQLDALFQFALQKNETGVGTWGRTVFARLSWSETLAGAIGGLGLAVALIVMRKRRLGFWRRSAIAMAVGVASAMLTRPAAEALVKFSQPLSILALRVGALVVIGMIWWIAPAGFFKLGATLEMAAGLGNLLSLLYPPFRVVDFMYSRLTARGLRYGVFNLADLYVPIGYACLAVGAIQYVASRFRRSGGARRPIGGPITGE